MVKSSRSLQKQFPKCRRCANKNKWLRADTWGTVSRELNYLDVFEGESSFYFGFRADLELFA